VLIELDYDNAIRVSAWIGYALNVGLSEQAAEDFAPLLDQIDSQSHIVDVLECQGDVEWIPSTPKGRLF